MSMTLCSFPPQSACEEKQQNTRKEISSRSWFSGTSATPRGAAGNLLQRIDQQRKKAAVAKALGSPNSPLIRKRTDACATASCSQPHGGLDTGDGGNSGVAQWDEASVVSPSQVGTETQDRSSAALGSLVPDYNDSDSDPGQ